MRRVQIGKKCTKGRGAGGRPEVAAQAANEDRDEIEKILKGATMVFIAVGMGGGTGTGAAPIIAEIAKSLGILTVGVVTKPFAFEREHKMNQALKGIAEMRKHVDALLIVPNQRLLKINEKAINFKAAFEMVDDVLYKAVKSISELVNSTAFINIDFADLKATLENAGDAHIAIGVGSGERKAEEAVQQVVTSPLLETSLNNAGKVLVNVSLSEDTLLTEVDEVMTRITEVAHPDVEVIHGVDYNPELKDTIVVTLIATCFSDNGSHEPVRAGVGTGSDETITTIPSSSAGLSDYITKNLDPQDDHDRFTDLEELLRRR
jgi:cell division protein FtsZ